MQVNNDKLDLILVRQRKSLRELRGDGLSQQTLTRIRRSEPVKPKSVGTLAAALGVDVTEILEEA